MKFLCTRSFEHSGVCSYTKGIVYSIAASAATALAALDKNRKAGAMEFFTPVDAEASEFMQSLTETKGKSADSGGKTPQGEAGNGNDGPPPKPPTKAELAAEAQALGITLTGREKNADIAALIETAQAAKQKEAGNGEGGEQ
jgi:hypothetical protein